MKENEIVGISNRGVYHDPAGRRVMTQEGGLKMNGVDHPHKCGCDTCKKYRELRDKAYELEREAARLTEESGRLFRESVMLYDR